MSQQYVLMPSQVRHVYFVAGLRALQERGDGAVIVFTPTCRVCEELSLMLADLKQPCTALHSEMSQSDRLASLGRFRSGHVQILIATDVAARGLVRSPVLPLHRPLCR